MRQQESPLREWRRANNLVLRDVARVAGISVAMLSAVERGRRNLRPINRLKIARRLGLPIEQIFPVDSDVAILQ